MIRLTFHLFFDYPRITLDKISNQFILVIVYWYINFRFINHQRTSNNNTIGGYMARLKQAKVTLQESYDVFNQAVEKKLPVLSLSNSDSIKNLLDIVIRRESIAVTKKTSFPNKLSADLRKKLADVLLLLDKVDIEIIKANAKSPSIDKVKN